LAPYVLIFLLTTYLWHSALEILSDCAMYIDILRTYLFYISTCKAIQRHNR